VSTLTGTGRAHYSPRPDPLYHVVLLAMCGGVLVLATMLSVQNQTQVVVPFFRQPLPELCLARRITGVGCPGCGLTRCFISLMHGDLAAAWQYNGSGLLLFGLMAAQIPFRSIQLWRIRRGLPELNTGWTAHILLSLLAVWMIGQWALRLCGVPI
jgi:Protein of unknown function (DUF2752)